METIHVRLDPRETVSIVQRQLHRPRPLNALIIRRSKRVYVAQSYI